MRNIWRMKMVYKMANVIKMAMVYTKPYVYQLCCCPKFIVTFYLPRFLLGQTNHIWRMTRTLNTGPEKKYCIFLDHTKLNWETCWMETSGVNNFVRPPIGNLFSLYCTVCQQWTTILGSEILDSDTGWHGFNGEVKTMTSQFKKCCKKQQHPDKDTWCGLG